MTNAQLAILIAVAVMAFDVLAAGKVAAWKAAMVLTIGIVSALGLLMMPV